MARFTELRRYRAITPADVNKRTSRLLANLPQIRANLCPLTFLDVPEQAYNLAVLGVYEMTRTDFYATSTCGPTNARRGNTSPSSRTRPNPIRCATPTAR